MISFIPTPAGWRDDAYGSPAELSNTERLELNILNVQQNRACQGCLIIGADFSGQDLQGANFSHAILDGMRVAGISSFAECLLGRSNPSGRPRIPGLIVQISRKKPPCGLFLFDGNSIFLESSDLLGLIVNQPGC